VCDLQTFLTPWDLLHKLKDIENMVGRTRSFINAPRIIDIDILIYGELNIESPGLTVPHPTMHMRYFVLKPLLDLNPFIKHPVWGGFLSRFAAKLDPTSVRECLADSTLVNKP
jgi:7,8-dihydro-6-hydroxymethylpterin-pyrophosphokinase